MISSEESEPQKQTKHVSVTTSKQLCKFKLSYTKARDTHYSTCRFSELWLSKCSILQTLKQSLLFGSSRKRKFLSQEFCYRRKKRCSMNTFSQMLQCLFQSVQDIDTIYNVKLAERSHRHCFNHCWIKSRVKNSMYTVLCIVYTSVFVRSVATLT